MTRVSMASLMFLAAASAFLSSCGPGGCNQPQETPCVPAADGTGCPAEGSQ